ncbi:hypothetical protein J6590_057154 [Homalodisca vitripennis]|nr:hypothetical protein J6590_057154 [Homalodisca vitripennis]
MGAVMKRMTATLCRDGRGGIDPGGRTPSTLPPPLTCFHLKTSMETRGLLMKNSLMEFTDELSNEEFTDKEFTDKEFAYEEFTYKEFADEEFADEEFGDEEFADEEFADEEFADEEFADEEFSDEEFTDESLMKNSLMKNSLMKNSLMKNSLIKDQGFLNNVFTYKEMSGMSATPTSPPHLLLTSSRDIRRGQMTRRLCALSYA